MELTGKNLIGFSQSAGSGKEFFAFDPEANTSLEHTFYEATAGEIDNAIQLAEKAFRIYRKKTGVEKASFLEAIGDEIMAMGENLISVCRKETGLPEGRLIGERGRTVNQLKLFAELLREGSWVDARIDTAIPDRTPIPKPDIRQLQIPIGPVGIFGASNFPLAFSVAGGDTASALAAGCSVVVKGHPAHPGTSEIVGQAIVNAVKKTGMPEGVFSLIQGPSIEVGKAIVRHPLIKAIGFTGSFRGGKALFDEAVRRPEPIPVYAEMGSTNPVFILPGALAERKEKIAEGLKNAVTLGVGQFCTNPGMVISMDSAERKSFVELSQDLFIATDPATMLTPTIQDAYKQGLNHLQNQPGVETLASGKSGGATSGQAYLMEVDASELSKNDSLSKEVFGPSTLMIKAGSKDDLLTIANQLEGHLTATVHGTSEDLEEYRDLLEILEQKAGRVIINGFPTGVEVCQSMVHGGPFPATTDPRTTSVGTAAILRFTRPVCYQDFPQALLPPELHDENPLGLMRIVNGQRKR